ncbi:MAG: ABC transporter permease [Erysipelotrichaceae bacterium]|nr:ABC transporter permease [Erysipelotrichaceae bacterium]
MDENKTTKFFSKPLIMQDIKSNLVLMIIITLVMCLMSVVINYASSMMGSGNGGEDVTDAQTDFYSYLYIMASYNEAMGTELSYDDFVSSDDMTLYETVFDFTNGQSDMDLSVDDLNATISELETSDVSIETYIREFEYVYALSSVQGCFSGDDLDVEDMMNTMFETMGVSSDLISNMSNMDMTSLMSTMYFTIMGILPMLIFLVVVANSLMVNQVDSGSMAFVLSTPTKRNAVAITHAVYLIVAPFLMIACTCAARVISSFIIYEEVEVTRIIVSYLGMYLLSEAIAGICYAGSCFASLSRDSMAFGGGLTVWFFLASLIGLFGSDSLVSTGMGVEELSVFNKLTISSLFDIDAISTIGTSSVDDTFIWKLGVLFVIAVVCYIAGIVRFKRKDLPL